MNRKKLITSTALSLALVGSGLHFALGEAPAVTKPAPKLAPDQFRAKLKKDAAALPANSGQIVMSYSDVAQKIMPSVVRIVASVPVKGLAGAGRGFGGGGGGFGGGGMDEEQMRELFRQRFPWLFPQGADPFGGGNDDEDLPRKRKRSAPREDEEDKADEKPKKPNHPSQKGVGSGVIISADGFILTNNHVVADAEKLDVTVGNETKTYKATVIGTDPRTDVAVIKIDGMGLPAATLGDSTKLRVGDVVLAAGNPMELSQTLTQGIVSAVGRTGQHIIGRNTGAGIENFIQTDAAINPGNSGGPLVDALGRVVGINTAIMTQSGMNAGIGFSIPINLALRVGEDLVDDGKVTRGFLGVGQMETVSAEETKSLGIDANGGVSIGQVVEASPAEKAGLQVGDVAIGIDGQHVDNREALSSLVGSARPGDPVEIEVVRGKQRLKLKVILGGASDDQLMAGAKKGEKEDAPPAPGGKKAPAKLVKGMTAQDLTDGLRDRYDIPAEIKVGVVIVAIEPNTPAAAAGLMEGDVIYDINNEKADNLVTALKLAKQSDGPLGLKIMRQGKKLFKIVRDKANE